MVFLLKVGVFWLGFFVCLFVGWSVGWLLSGFLFGWLLFKILSIVAIGYTSPPPAITYPPLDLSGIILNPFLF